MVTRPLTLPQAGVSRSTWLGVTVLDENDWWPEWERLSYHGSVLQTAGAVCVSGSLDTVAGTTVRLRVWATDGGSPGRCVAPAQSSSRPATGAASSTATAEIIIDEAPLSTLVFTQDQYWANVIENSTKEMNVAALGVKGQPLNHHVRYSILNSNIKFEIHPTAGVIKTTGKSFDREAEDHYTLVVEAQDIEGTANVAHVLVHVAVMDVNDNEPVFLNQPFHALVSTVSPRSHVVTKVQAIDADSGEFGSVRYELVRGSGELFAVNKKTGEISLKQTLMAADKTYSLTVAAYDGGKPPLSSQAHVLIRVVSSEGPMFTAARYEAAVPENAAKGTPVVRVEAASPSGEPIMYTIVAGNTEELFGLDYSTGVVQTTALLDYEASASHNLTVRARDPFTGGHTDTHVTAAVMDVNDNPPKFSRSVLKGDVSEAASPGHVVLQVSASDVDTGPGGSVRYSCVMECGSFEVRALDGAVTLTKELDAETEAQHVLTVLATDSGIPQLSSTATVVIDVVDFNDNPPAWRQDSYSCRVSAEAQPGHVVTSVSATDPDAGQVTPLSYAIHSGDRDAIFKMDQLTGVLTVTAPHKLKDVASLTLNLSVSDGVHAAFTGLHVSGLASNHHAPR
ncbi:protocadherin Fat 1-like [Eriocheir sinensis]|uniref:protocadherin Fat 1-like n=1 Tax=Eriocheir sinensis TaxID=95602 RepID=UPI0021C66829|nr:protocadherin Fat 1-like [Eriocheir sinensis]